MPINKKTFAFSKELYNKCIFLPFLIWYFYTGNIKISEGRLFYPLKPATILCDQKRFFP